MKLTRPAITTLGMLALLLAIALGGRYLSPLLPKTDAEANADPGCDLNRGPCGAGLPEGGRLTLSIGPRPVPVLVPLALEAAIDGLAADRIEVDFSGESMNMGYNRVALSSLGENRYAGSASLPVCISGGMTWVVTVLVESGRRRIAVRYRLEVKG